MCSKNKPFFALGRGGAAGALTGGGGGGGGMFAAITALEGNRTGVLSSSSLELLSMSGEEGYLHIIKE